MTTDPENPGPPAGTAPFRRHAAALDLFAGCHAMSARRLAGIVAVAASLAGLLNAEALALWAIGLPPALGPLRDALVSTTQWWADATAAAGLEAPYRAVRAAFRRFQDWDLGG